MKRAQLAGIGVVAGVVTIIGAIGPWATFRGVSFAGTDANRGVTVAVAAGVGLLLLALAGWRNAVWPAALAAVAGLVAVGLTLWSFAAINAFANAPADLPIGRGWGIWLSAIGSIVLVAASIWAALVKEHDAAVELPSETSTN